jgi:hypothetical protein
MQPQAPEACAAFVGLDWADAKHDICLQVTGSTRREFLRLEHRPEMIDLTPPLRACVRPRHEPPLGPRLL